MSKDKKFIHQLILGAGAIAVIMVLVIVSLNLITRHNKELEVPDFSGMTFKEATIIAKRSHLRLEITDSVFLSKIGRGEIFRQIPAAGSKVKKNRRVILTINSLQPKKVTMPSVTGYSLRQAKAELAVRQLNIGRLIYVEDMATNNVLAQLHNGVEIAAGSMIEAESEIDLKLGASPDQNLTSIPSVVGFSLTTAKDILTDNSLNIGRLTYDSSVKNFSDSLSAFVLMQRPLSTDLSQYPLGSRVDLTLSIDKEKLENLTKAQ